MTLEEYISDQRALVARLKIPDSERIRFVQAYLKARKFTDDELRFLVKITEDQISEKMIEAYEEERNRPPDDYDFLPPEIVGDRPPIEPSWKHEEELLLILTKKLGPVAYPFQPILPRLLASPEKQKDFEAAETFMLEHGYFKPDGSWEENLPIGDLVTFLNLLIKAEVLKYSTEKDMNSYFSERYRMDSIGALMRWNKMKDHTQFGTYFLLITRLGLKLDDFMMR